MLGESVELAIFYNLCLSRVPLQLLPEKVNRKSGNGVHSATCMCDAHRSPIFDLLSLVKVGVRPARSGVRIDQKCQESSSWCCNGSMKLFFFALALSLTLPLGAPQLTCPDGKFAMFAGSVTSGTCDSNGYENITSLADCSMAMAARGVTATPREISWGKRASGCTPQGFNTKGQDIPCSDSKQCICFSGCKDASTCPARSYVSSAPSNYTSAAVCLPCPVGTTTSSAGQSSCALASCPSGKHASFSATIKSGTCESNGQHGLASQTDCLFVAEAFSMDVKVESGLQVLNAGSWVVVVEELVLSFIFLKVRTSA